MHEYREKVVTFTALVEIHFIKYQRYCDLAKLKVVVYTVYVIDELAHKYWPLR